MAAEAVQIKVSRGLKRNPVTVIKNKYMKETGPMTSPAPAPGYIAAEPRMAKVGTEVRGNITT